MSHFEGDVFVIENEKPQQCDDCGQIAELRPYGPGGTSICMPCGQKDIPGLILRTMAVVAQAKSIERRS